MSNRKNKKKKKTNISFLDAEDDFDYDDEEPVPIPECITQAQSLVNLRDYQKAAEAFRDCLRFVWAPEILASIYNQLQSVLFHIGREQRNFAPYKQEILHSLSSLYSLRLESMSKHSFGGLGMPVGQRLSILGEHEEAVSVLRQVIVQGNSDSRDFTVNLSRVYLANSLYQLGRISEALEVGHYLCSQKDIHIFSGYDSKLPLSLSGVQFMYELMLDCLKKTEVIPNLRPRYETLLAELIEHRTNFEKRKIGPVLETFSQGFDY